jgi:urea transport system permease protein
MSLPRPLLLALVAAALLLPAWAARALTPAQAHAISAGDSDARVAALQQALLAGDPRVPVLVRALLDGAVQVDAERAWIVAADGSAVDAATGQPAPLPAEGVEEAVNNNRMRGELQPRWPRWAWAAPTRPSVAPPWRRWARRWTSTSCRWWRPRSPRKPTPA